MRLPLIILAATSLAGCAVGPDFEQPDMALRPRYMSAGVIDTRTKDADWWRGFYDPVLVSLVDKAIAGNTDLAKAFARIEQSRAAARGAVAALLPSADGTGSATAVRQSLDSPLGAASHILGLPRDYNEYALGAEASWELDVFGGLRRSSEAAHADFAASEADAGAIAVSVAAETADAYLTLRGLQTRLAIADNQVKTEQGLVGVVRQRFNEGLAPERELNRAEAELESVRSSTAPLRAAIAAQLNRLDVLVGDEPGANRALLAGSRAIPAAPRPAGSAAPTDLLRRRPDIVAAEARLAASNARIGVAIADYYPHVSLAGLVGSASTMTSNLFTAGAVQASGGASVRWRLFDFGRVDAEVAQAKGRDAEALAAWRGAALHAAEDVETALVRLAEARTERASLVRQIEQLRKARDETRRAYAGGVAVLIDVFDADRQELAASDRLATVRANEARAAVAAYRALGGGWQPGTMQTIAANGGRIY
ncbi:efflux transporter outer membrane subunit [Bradyrhizobium sp. dw_411]|uniref:efflux transporter outer membrane subunit n=1 Tax=Bradyrhizobium sp. dw_411 TaxID=2720082 RepID=UPI001BCFFD3D|nr:efflux transporter outer membrane subunit [Bradyrhizobium sp. dw_411]